MIDYKSRVTEFYAEYDRTKGGNASDFIAMCAPNIKFGSLGGEVAGAEYLAVSKSRKDVEAYISNLFANWTMNYFRVKKVIVDGDTAVAVSDISFTNKATGKTLESQKADILKFDGELVVEFFEFFDTAGFRAAMA